MKNNEQENFLYLTQFFVQMKHRQKEAMFFFTLFSYSFQVLVLICLLMCRFGGERGRSNVFYIGSESDHFLAVGTYVGFAIIVPAILVTYLLGANLTILVRALP